MENRILQEDIDSFRLPDELTERLRNSTILVTGATGLIGSVFVKCLAGLDAGIRFVLPVRNAEKAAEIFEAELASGSVTIVESKLTEFFSTASDRCDYILHCASPTDGKYMCAHPTETFMLAVDSTRALLDYSRRHGTKGIVYLSSIEQYGQMNSDAPIAEEMEGYVDRQSPRSSYALGKQAAEYLCYCYATEYGMPVKTARLTQTFGAGIRKDDKRVFAQFARSVIEGRDIVLHTEGVSAKPYCYTTDCVSALIHILLKGQAGEAYNVATPGSYITIRGLAELCRNCFNPAMGVRVQPLENAGYAPDTRVNLDSGKLLAMGWTPRYGLREMMGRLIDYLQEE
ncbi:MAG: NAD(P)-dependent oxidoreductase [Muribaculaceae bacterium]|nr:NAD(P)-dependent oxidoreductase [Muribaculaceae bacterium]